MKCVMLSVHPKWCELIASGKKTIEVRKTKPNLQTPFKCYIYCTRPTHFYSYAPHLRTSSEFLHLCEGMITMSDGFELFGREDYKTINCKVIGDFVCDKIIEVDCDSVAPFDRETKEYVESKICFGREEFIKYAGLHCAYGWHISDLKIYDEPKELSEFTRYCDGGVNGKIGCKGCEYYYRDCNEIIGDFEGCSCDNSRPITKPPQSWCYVEE